MNSTDANRAGRRPFRRSVPSLAAGTLVVVALAAIPTRSPAWEAATTHPGLTEQAALYSSLHEHLRTDLGIERGLFASLIVPPRDAPALFEIFSTINPTHGYVPDSRGRMLALGWLAAGSVVADTPAAHAANHFFDPTTGKGLDDDTVRGVSDRLRHAIYTRLARDSIRRSGRSATEWIDHADNPMSVARFFDQYDKAVRSVTPAERERHVAGALLAAGALLHVLQDMGSPSHVRGDLAAHLDVVGDSQVDVGSRFERVAALAYGRLGVPAPSMRIVRPDLRSFFTSEDRTGLADRTAVRWFSAHTLPSPVPVRPGASPDALAPLLTQSLARPLPAPLPSLDLRAAETSQGAALVDGDGVCVARYQLRDRSLSWYLDAECMAEQVAVILPEVASYSAGLLDWLFRGSVAIATQGNDIFLAAGGADFGKGSLEFFWDDGRGVRTRYGKQTEVEKAQAGEIFATIPTKLPGEAVAVAALFRGVDTAGQPMIAVGYQRLTGPSAK